MGEDVATKPAQSVEEGTTISVTTTGPTWVGRGAEKMVGALAAFGPQGLSAAGKLCLDVGASTGGFTQVLLAHGAEHVIALDVGHDQLDPVLATDPRVTDLPGTNIRDVTPETIGGPVDLIVSDLSFISLRLVIPVLATLIRPRGDLVLLVKPQFEVGRERLGRNGIVRDDAARRSALLTVARCAIDAGLAIRGVVPSPIRGGTGNVEYLLWMSESNEPGLTWQSLTSTVDALAVTDHDPEGGATA